MRGGRTRSPALRGPAPPRDASGGLAGPAGPHPQRRAPGAWCRAGLAAAALAAPLLVLAVRPRPAGAAAPTTALSVTPSIVEGTPGTTATIWVQAPAGDTLRTHVYAFDPASGSLSPPGAGEGGWLRVGAAGAAETGRGRPFAVTIAGPPEPPARDAYLDVVFAAAGPGPAAGTGPEVAAGSVVAFRGSAPPPAGWTAALTGPHVVWLVGGTWDVQVQGTAGGWIAPVVRAQLRGRGSAVSLGPILPGARGQATVRLRGGLPGVALLRVQVQSGGRTVTLTRRILVLPGAVVLGALAGLGAAAAVAVFGDRTGRKGRRAA